MKKVLTVLVALAMIFSLAASAEEAASAAGLWTLTTAESAGVTFDAVEMGMEMTMDLAEDGTCVLTLNGENEMGTWEQNGAEVAVLDSTGAEQAFQLMEDGTLTASQEDMKLIFTRDGETAAGEPARSYSFALPEGWFELTPESLEELHAAYGEEAVAAMGVTQEMIDTLALANGSIYYAPTLTSQMNTTVAAANGMTLEVLSTMEAQYAEMFEAAGMEGYAFSGMEEAGGKAFLHATYTVNGMPGEQYYYIDGDELYTLTFTNVADADLEALLSSFTVD